MKKTVDQSSHLLDFLSEIFPNTSKGKLRKMLTAGRIAVNDEMVHKAKHELNSGDVVEVRDRAKAKEEAPNPKDVYKGPKLKIIYEDEAIIVVNKPEGLLSVATDKLEVDTLHSRCVEWLKFNDETAWCYIVHRLDRDTSGVMVLAKHRRHKEYLQQQFADRDVHRIYHALVEGGPNGDSGTARAFLYEDKHLHVKKVSSTFKGGKEAITHWDVVDRDEDVSLIHISIQTGRRHQIRMAMKDLGCPVVGDELHGAKTDPLNRVCLHATALEFLHPDNDDPVRFETRIPFVN